MQCSQWEIVSKARIRIRTTIGAGVKARSRALGNEDWRICKQKLYFTFFVIVHV